MGKHRLTTDTNSFASDSHLELTKHQLSKGSFCTKKLNHSNWGLLSTLAYWLTRPQSTLAVLGSSPIDKLLTN